MNTWENSTERLCQLRQQAELGGGEARIEHQHQAGKLTARERIGLLLDEGSFVEVGSLMASRIDAFGMDKRRVPGDGVVAGYGKINGRTVCVASQDFTVIGGTLGEVHAQKICAIQDMAMNMQVPFICINDSGGARIEEGIRSLNGYAGVFLRNTRASGVIPQIAVIVGPCAGGACYSPAICDFIFMVRKTGNMFITGPKVVQQVIGEKVSVEQLGGADVHAKTSGVSHFTYDDERSCFEGVRKLLEYLPQNYQADIPFSTEKCADHSRCLSNIVPDNLHKTYDVHDVIATIVDRGTFFEVQESFAKNVVIGFAFLDGKSVGIVANQPTCLAGALDCDGSDKMARFIRFCDCFNLPIITLVDVPAFFPGKDQEYKGIIRHGAKILFAYSEATVPKITLIMRKAFGGAYIAMNSKGIGADIVYAWPIAEIAVMGAEGACEIMYSKELKQAENREQLLRKKAAEYEKTLMNALSAAECGFVDEIIEVQETRKKLCSALNSLESKKMSSILKKHANIPL